MDDRAAPFGADSAPEKDAAGDSDRDGYAQASTNSTDEPMAEDTLRLCAAHYDAGMRLDLWLHSQRPDISRSAWQKLCALGLVFRDNRPKPLSKSYRVALGDSFTVTLPPPTPLDVVPKSIPLDILYEDDDLLVVNKPKGMVVHPAPGHYDDTLVNALLYHCASSLSGIGGVLRPGIVHRLDRDTSGLLMVAKNDAAHLALAEQIQSHSFLRLYEAVVYGRIDQPEGTLSFPLGRHPTLRKQQCVRSDGRPSITRYRVIALLRDFTHLSLKLETGRTHQIRVHMAHIGHPVAGDPVYGPKKVITSLGGQCLHAATLGFTHPRTGVHLSFTAPPPPVFTQFLQSKTP